VKKLTDGHQVMAIPFGPGELKKENNSVYYFRERISLYSCDIVERRTNLMISTSHGICRQLYHRQYLGLLCQFPSLSVHDSVVRTKYLYLKLL
jgi:hypothetical protein